MQEVRPVNITPRNSGRKRLFKSPILETLSHTHIAVPLTIFFSFAGGLLWWSIEHTALSAWVTAALFVLGAFSFTWVEYMMHRYLFHMGTFTRTRERLQYLIHGVHHEFPKDKSRLAMPPLLSVTLSLILLFVFRVLLGDLVFAFLPGFLVGYSYYLSIHYMVHAYPPPKNFLRKLWLNHSIHHYKNGEVVFGVSSPFWDYVYGTSL